MHHSHYYRAITSFISRNIINFFWQKKFYRKGVFKTIFPETRTWKFSASLILTRFAMDITWTNTWNTWIIQKKVVSIAQSATLNIVAFSDKTVFETILMQDFFIFKKTYFTFSVFFTLQPADTEKTLQIRLANISCWLNHRADCLWGNNAEDCFKCHRLCFFEFFKNTVSS